MLTKQNLIKLILVKQELEMLQTLIFTQKYQVKMQPKVKLQALHQRRSLEGERRWKFWLVKQQLEVVWHCQVA
jgi:hypothetical protein